MKTHEGCDNTLALFAWMSLGLMDTTLLPLWTVQNGRPASKLNRQNKDKKIITNKD